MTVLDALQTPFYHIYDFAVALAFTALGLVCTIVRLIVQAATTDRRALRRTLVACTRDFAVLYEQLSAVPGGKQLFSVLVGVVAPYSASIGSVVQELTPVKCTVTMNDRPHLHNPFRSIHAAALTNLGELTSGLLVVSYFGRAATTTAAAADASVDGKQSGGGGAAVRVKRTGIVTRLSTTFYKKARGTVTCRCDATTLPTELGVHEVVVEAVHTDANQVVCAKTQAVWQLKIEEQSAAAGKSKTAHDN